MLCSAALSVIARLNQAGFSAFAVGGCVRDFVRGCEASDYDIATSAMPNDVLTVFSDCRCIPTGLQHGTVTVIYADISFEITTFRKDGEYTDNRRPDRVTFTSSLQDDLARRDFTVNAMAYHPDCGIVDPFDGQQDLENGILRCVGDPVTRFTEDALRIARMFRFAAVLGLTPHPDTAAAAVRLGDRLSFVAAERKRVELEKALFGEHFLSIALAFPSVLCELVPTLTPLVAFDQHSKHHDFDVYTHTVRAVNAAPPDRLVKLAALFHDIGKPATFSLDDNNEGHFYGHAEHGCSLTKDALQALRFDNDIVARVFALVKHHHLTLRADRRLLRRWLAKLGADDLRRLISLKQADAVACKDGIVAPSYEEELALIHTILEEQDCLSRRDLHINGNDLLTLGYSHGPHIGAMLDDALDAVINDLCPNEQHALTAFIKERYPNV